MKFTYTPLIFLIAGLSMAFAKEKGAPPMMTGAPGEHTCAKSRCHTSYDLNSGSGKIEIQGFPKYFTPGETYNLTIIGKQADIKTWGFELTMADAKNKPSGTLATVDDKHTQLIDPRRYRGRSDLQYITHTKAGVHAGSKGESMPWPIRWTAPTATDSPANLFVAVNAANGDDKKYHDHVYTLHLISEPLSTDSLKTPN